MMSLSILAILLGLGVIAVQLYGLRNPDAFQQWADEFPRSVGWGYVLVALATAWFLYNINRETIADFAPYKPMMLIGFGLLGFLTCLFVKDFLAVRGLAVVMLLLAKLMVDTARWAETEWRLVIVVWAYMMVIAGMWFTIAPWRFRDLLHWATANHQRIRWMSSCRLAFGLLVLVLGIFVY